MRLALLITLLGTLGAAPASTEFASENDLVEFIARQNEQTRSRLGTVSFSFTREYEHRPEGKTHIQTSISGRWIQSGPEEWLRASRHSRYSDNPKDAQDEALTLFVGRHSSALYTTGTKSAFEFEHEDPSRMSSRESDLVTPMFSRNPLLEAFGFSDRPLREAVITTSGPGVHWEGTKESDGRYELQRYIPRQGSPDIILTVDPSHGWLIVERRLLSESQGLVEKTTLTTTQHQPDGAWYPSTVHCERYSRSAGADPSLLFAYTTTINSLTPNAPITPGQFSIESLELPVGTQLSRLSTNGKTTILSQSPQGLATVAQRPGVSIATLSPVKANHRTGAIAVIAGAVLLSCTVVLGVARRQMKKRLPAGK